MLYPLDKQRNAERGRRALAPVDDSTSVNALPANANARAGMAPLLDQLMGEYAAAGIPPAYLPFVPEDTEP